MGCCNQKRNEFARQAQQVQSIENDAALSISSLQTSAHQSFRFRYIGKSSFTIRGTISKKLYRFHCPLAELEIDHRDSSAFFAIPEMVKV
jgi:hypothetical protein